MIAALNAITAVLRVIALLQLANLRRSTPDQLGLLQDELNRLIDSQRVQ